MADAHVDDVDAAPKSKALEKFQRGGEKVKENERARGQRLMEAAREAKELEDLLSEIG